MEKVTRATMKKIQIDKIWRIKNARELCASVIDIRRTVVLPQFALYGLLVQGPTSFVSWNISSFVRWIIYPNFRRSISYVYILSQIKVNGGKFRANPSRKYHRYSIIRYFYNSEHLPQHIFDTIIFFYSSILRYT